MFSEQSYDILKQRILDNMNINIDKREGSFVSNMVSPISIELSKTYMALGDILNLGFIEDTFDKFLDTRISEFGVYRKVGQKARGSVIVTGDDGTIIENGTIFLCEDLQFVMLNDVVIGQEDNTCYLEALEIGNRYNVLSNSIFTIQNGLDGVEAIVNSNDFEGGVDIESDEDLRKRFIKVVNNPSTSGNKAHYEEWALEVDGVSRAVVYPLWDGNGTVKVMIIGPDNTPVSDNIISNVKNHIDEVKPIGCTLTITTPSLLDVIIKSNIELSDGYSIDDINEGFSDSLTQYINTIASELTYSKVYGIMANLIGVEDILSLTLNDGTSNISIPEDKIINISDIQISEVV